MACVGLTSYDRLDPGFPLASFVAPFDALAFHAWSREEARAYFNWFTEQIPARKRVLKELLDPAVMKLDDGPDSLHDLGAFLVDHAHARPMTPEERNVERMSFPEPLRSTVELDDLMLDNTTISLCIDIGIYFCEVVRTAHPSLRWKLWLRKTVDQNQPVLVGFRGGVPLSVLPPLSIAWGAVRGDKQPNGLCETYRVWSQDVESLK